MTNKEIRKAIEKYQVEHPLRFGMLDVTALSSKEGVDFISQTIEQISEKITEDTELWCICEMAKLYMQGVTPVYPVRQQGKWIKNEIRPNECQCANCGNYDVSYFPFCHWCGADMRKEAENE